MIIAGLAMAALAVAVLGVRLLLKSVGSLDGSFSGAVGDRVEILRDGRGTPMIKAENWGDACFALGYIHAQDRLVMIEYYRALARGRIQELFENDAGLMDRLAAVMGFHRRAGEILARLKSPHREYLDAYAAGVNLMKDRKYREVVRFSRLPDDPWTARDVIAILLLVDWSQAFLANRELRFALPDRLRTYPIRDIIPEDMLYWYSDAEQKNVFALRELKNAVSDFVGSFSSGFACLVPTSLTHDGSARIIFNLDVPLRLYPSWYPVCFRVADGELDGVSFSGMPFVFTGRNPSMAFSSFTMKADTQDFHIETTRKQKDSEQYLGAFGWRDFEVTEGATVPGVAAPVRSTERGPVVSDIFAGMYRTDCITVRSLFPGEDYIAALFDVPLAVSPAAARMRLANVTSPPRAYLFSSGEYALRGFSGKIPLRLQKAGLSKNQVFNPIWTGVADISNYFEAAGRDVSLIGGSIAEGVPPAMRDSLQYDEEERTARIRDLSGAGGVLDIAALQRALRDTYSISAAKFVPLFIRLLEKIPVTSARLTRIYFMDWDYRMRKDSVAATIYQTLVIKLVQETMGDECKNEISGILEHHHHFSDSFLKAIEEEKSILFDDITTSTREERRDDIFDRAFLRSMRYLNDRLGPIMENWTWGSLHTGHFSVPLIDESAFWSRLFHGRMDEPFEGGFATVYRGTSLPLENFKADVTSCLSGIYDTTAGTYSASYSYSLNPFSDYFDYRMEYGNFAAFRPDDTRHRIEIRPMK
ncbi:MAG TPA: penicillin acylase family protein [Spirochaetota bacterium]|nr:penicillin acylase family protein [Spirochaetota bacterium]